MKTWGDIFRKYVKRGEDHSSAAYRADQFEERVRRFNARTMKNELLCEIHERWAEIEQLKKTHAAQMAALLKVADAAKAYCDGAAKPEFLSLLHDLKAAVRAVTEE
jgi:hypothetical protein